MSDKSEKAEKVAETDKEKSDEKAEEPPARRRGRRKGSKNQPKRQKTENQPALLMTDQYFNNVEFLGGPPILSRMTFDRNQIMTGAASSSSTVSGLQTGVIHEDVSGARKSVVDEAPKVENRNDHQSVPQSFENPYYTQTPQFLSNYSTLMNPAYQMPCSFVRTPVFVPRFCCNCMNIGMPMAPTPFQGLYPKVNPPKPATVVKEDDQPSTSAQQVPVSSLYPYYQSGSNVTTATATSSATAETSELVK